MQQVSVILYHLLFKSMELSYHTHKLCTPACEGGGEGITISIAQMRRPGSMQVSELPGFAHSEARTLAQSVRVPCRILPEPRCYRNLVQVFSEIKVTKDLFTD